MKKPDEFNDKEWELLSSGSKEAPKELWVKFSDYMMQERAQHPTRGSTSCSPMSLKKGTQEIEIPYDI
eukprot:CAMPEP_0201508108 /NCGR_PEP_ID=MMETSP0161_2-20130828/1565_1 /ASSEMBLY_ACC=CAM_ASM_000251 /TAXON_ID=180227 /ORGANISM="Neoparamoeba aestuarina, Strain SoJaBio B1-5/56/2" /LENGTH=67 /DNA_ID=CAMNT_0047902657 /DNA_START=173 /DNA_END=376 /DNA_ORIENTATION=-